MEKLTVLPKAKFWVKISILLPNLIKFNHDFSNTLINAIVIWNELYEWKNVANKVATDLIYKDFFILSNYYKW